MAVILPILSTFNAAGIKSAQASLGGLGKSLGRLGGPIAAALGGFNALQGAVNFAGEAISEARDLERNMAALGTVFNDLTPRMTNFVDNAYKMGLSQVEAARTSTFLGSVLKQAGLPMDDVAQKTEELTILAQDLATTFGYDTSEALTAMTALFRGEYDPIEKFGVALKQNEVNALVAAKGLGHLTGQEMLNAQQTVRMEQLFLRSADAAGAFARQSGTLFVEQKKLTAVFSNMQSAVGSGLTPALARLMQQMTPIVEDLTPGLKTTFGAVADVIEDLTPALNPLGQSLVNLLDIFNGLVVGVANLTGEIAPGLVDAFDALDGLIYHVSSGLEEIVGAMTGLGDSTDGLGGVLTFFSDAYNLISKMIPGLNNFAYVINLLKVAFPSEITAADFGTGGTQDRNFGKVRNMQIKKGVFDFSKTTTKEQGKGSAPKDVVKDFYKELADEVAKQSARLKLANMGASEAFIESIVGSGTDWKKVFAKVSASGKAGVANLQKQFNQTSAGIKEIADAFEETKKKAKEAFDEAYKAYEKLKDVYDGQVQAINDLKKALSDAASSATPLGVVTREIGQFEQSVIDSFTNIADIIAEGLAEGTLLKDAAASLTSYAKSEQVTIQEIMRQRDVLVGKRSLAKALMDDIKSTIMGMGNVTELLAKNTTDVTETITKMVGNVQVATSKVIKGVTGGSAGLVASFTETLAKTKAFAQQLKDLRALGLDSNIYQQIVSAGVDAGGTTAKAILEGGAGTVSELNGLFTELSDVGAAMAEEAAQVMYGSGIDLVDGLINGLISKEQELVNYATQLATAFTTAFNSQLATALPMPNAPVEPVYVEPTMPVEQFQKLRLGDVKLGGYDAKTTALASKLIAKKEFTAWTTTINVNAGFGTDGKATGQAVYTELKKFAKANGITV
jgi:phosphoglycolate phosphatase-like HAD superfamily hydrolase